MARLTPITLNILGGALTAANNIAQFASTVTGTPVYTNDPATIQALAAYVNGGIQASLIQTGGGLNSPVFQELTGLFYLLTFQMKALMQNGIPQGSTTETYYTGQFASDGAGNVFVSQQNNNTGHLFSDTNWWLPYGQTIKGAAVCKAWVNFNGNSAFINTQFNVASVVRVALGTYQINFTTAMANNAYTVTGTSGTPDGAPFAAGDNTVIVLGRTGQNGSRNTNSFICYAESPSTNALSDSGMISLQIFGT